MSGFNPHPLFHKPKLIMKLIIILILPLFSLNITAQEKPCTIIVDVNHTDKLYLSYFAEDVLSVSLENPTGNTLLSVSEVILTDRNIFVKSRYIGSPKTTRFLKYNLDGTFIEEIGLKNSQTKEFLRLHYVLPDYEKQEFLLKYSKYYAILDFDGRPKSRDECKETNVILSPIFNKYFWTLSQFIDIEKEIKNIYLIKKDKKGSNTDTLYHATASLNEVEKGYKRYNAPLPSMEMPTQWFTSNDKLFVSMAIEDVILEVDKYDRVNIVYKFIHKNISEESINRITYPDRFILERFIFYGYNIKSIRYYYVYDISKKEGFNVILRRNSSRKLISGIQDDIYNTGFIHLEKGFNSELFFTKNTEELKEQNIISPLNSNISLFLVVPKQ